MNIKKIIRVGESYGITLDKEEIKKLGLKEGDYIIITWTPILIKKRIKDRR